MELFLNSPQIEVPATSIIDHGNERVSEKVKMSQWWFISFQGHTKLKAEKHVRKTGKAISCKRTSVKGIAWIFILGYQEFNTQFTIFPLLIRLQLAEYSERWETNGYRCCFAVIYHGWIFKSLQEKKAGFVDTFPDVRRGKMEGLYDMDDAREAEDDTKYRSACQAYKMFCVRCLLAFTKHSNLMSLHPWY